MHCQVLHGVPPVYWFPSTAVAPDRRDNDPPKVRIGIPGCLFHKGGSANPYRTSNPTVITRLAYQHSSALFDTSVPGMNRNDKPLPMRISAANLRDQEGLLSHAQGGKSRPFSCEDYWRGVVLMLSPDL